MSDQGQMSLSRMLWGAFQFWRQGGAQKRAPSVVWPEGYGGSWGEPPPAPVTARPTLYLQSPAVWSAIEAFGNGVKVVPFHLYQEQADGEREEQKQHAALDILHNPNPFTTRSELFWYAVADMQLSGNCYWFLAGPDRGAPTEIWRCDPRRTRIVRSKTDYISGYVTEINGKTIPLDVGEVIHFKRPNPFDGLYGLSVLAVAALAAMTSYEMAKWNRKAFATENAVPAGVVNIKEHVSDPDFERLKQEWRASYGGGARRTAFLRGGAAEFQVIGLSQKEVDFLQGAQWEDAKIYRMFGAPHLIPATIRDDAKHYERQHLEGHVYPLLMYLAEVFTDKLLPFWGPLAGVGKLTFEFDDVRPRERALELEEGREQAKGLTVNEWRAERKLEPLDGGDDVMFVHMIAGTPLEFEMAALPEPEPVPPQFTEEPPPEEPESEANVPETADEKAERRESAGEEYGDEIGDAQDKAIDLAAIGDELGQWERFAVARVGRANGRPFKADVIPAIVSDAVQRSLDSLGGGATEVAIRAIFSQMQTLYGDGDAPIAPIASKAWETTAALYLRNLQDAVRRAFAIDPLTGDPTTTHRQFGDQGRTAITIGFRTAFMDGLAEGGVNLDKWSEVDPDDKPEVALEIKTERSYWSSLGAEVYQKALPTYKRTVIVLREALDNAQTPEAVASLEPQLEGALEEWKQLEARYIARMDMWLNKGLLRIYGLGKLAAQGNQMMEWVLGATKDHCRTCLAAAGQRHQAKAWRRSGIMPQSDKLECGGFNCDCELIVTTEKARGRLSRIPTKAIDLATKAVADMWPVLPFVNIAAMLFPADTAALEDIPDAILPALSDFAVTPPDELHVTLALMHWSSVDDEVVQTLLQDAPEALRFDVLTLEGATLAWYGEDEYWKALVLEVDGDGLRELQKRAYDLLIAQVDESAMSEYSDPATWKPHVTLGYGEPFELPALDGPVEFEANGLVICSDNYNPLVRIYGSTEELIETAGVAP